MSEIVGRRVVGLDREGGEADHFISCTCGQQLDMRRLGEVLEHSRKCTKGMRGAVDDVR